MSKSLIPNFFILAAQSLLVGLLAFNVSVHAKAPSTPLASFEENEAKVVITVEYDQKHQATLVAQFTPLQKGYHLYSKDLPRKGIEGIGRPTLIELAANSSIKARGPLTDSAPTLKEVIPEAKDPLLIYPNGPVTLRLPITLPAAVSGKLTDNVLVSYMTCSPQGQCTAPVTAKAVPITLTHLAAH